MIRITEKMKSTSYYRNRWLTDQKEKQTPEVLMLQRRKLLTVCSSIDNKLYSKNKNGAEISLEIMEH